MDGKIFSKLFHNMINIRNLMNCAVKFKLRSNLNLVSDLNENYTAKFHICKIIIFQLK